ncbi:MAG: hypothetical protein Q9203_004710 [Teloschistes exilis]
MLPQLSNVPRRYIIVLLAALFGLVAGSLFFGSSRLRPSSSWHESFRSVIAQAGAKAPPTQLREGNETLLYKAPTYVTAITSPEIDVFGRLDCPTPNATRYQEILDTDPSKSKRKGHWKYFFALELTQCLHILPRLMGSIVEAMQILGPRNCALSIVEGQSTDGTYEVLLSLRRELEKLDTTYFFTTSDVYPPKGSPIASRVAALAELRNLALQPLIDSSGGKGAASHETTVLFISDVSICTDDILELIYQRSVLGADMTCAMDWTYLHPNTFPTFHDYWIARTMDGDSFFNHPHDPQRTLFWNNNQTRVSLDVGQPFQVYSCWNGAVAVTAKPFLASGVRFRAALAGECPQGEPKSLCKDLWLNGYGKIAVVPSVNVEYSDAGARRVKEAKGYVSDWLQKGEDRLIEWEGKPPEKVKCMTPPDYNSTWPEWDAPKKVT